MKSSISNSLNRLVRKSLKKWCRYCYQGKDVYDSFHKCTIVSTCLNELYLQKKIDKPYFNKLIDNLSDVNINQPYTIYETQFLNKFEIWFNNK